MLAPADAPPVAVERAGRPQWRQAVGQSAQDRCDIAKFDKPGNERDAFPLTTTEEQSSWGAHGSHSTSSRSFADVQFDDSFRQTAFRGFPCRFITRAIHGRWSFGTGAEASGPLGGHNAIAQSAICVGEVRVLHFSRSISRNQHLSGLRAKRWPHGLWPGTLEPVHAGRRYDPQGSARRGARRISGGASGSLQTGGEPQGGTRTQCDAANIRST